MPSHLVPSLFQHLLKTKPRILQPPLQRSRADVKLPRNVLNLRPTPRQLPLNRRPHSLRKRLFPPASLQLFIELRRQHRQQLRILRNKRDRRIGRPKHNRIPRSTKLNRTSEVPFKRSSMYSGTHQFQPNRRDPCSRPMTCNAKHPRKAKVRKQRRLFTVRKQPPKLNAPLHIIHLMRDLFRTREQFVPRRLLHGFAEVRRRKRRQRNRIEVFRLRLRPQLQPNRRILARPPNPLPQSKQFFRRHHHPRLIQKSRRQTSTLKHRRHTDSRLSQSRRQPAGNPKVFAHPYALFNEAISIENRYFTSAFSNRSYASFTF